MGTGDDDEVISCCPGGLIVTGGKGEDGEDVITGGKGDDGGLNVIVLSLLLGVGAAALTDGEGGGVLLGALSLYGEWITLEQSESLDRDLVLDLDLDLDDSLV